MLLATTDPRTWPGSPECTPAASPRQAGRPNTGSVDIEFGCDAQCIRVRVVPGGGHVCQGLPEEGNVGYHDLLVEIAPRDAGCFAYKDASEVDRQQHLRIFEGDHIADIYKRLDALGIDFEGHVVQTSLAVVPNWTSTLHRDFMPNVQGLRACQTNQCHIQPHHTTFVFYTPRNWAQNTEPRSSTTARFDCWRMQSRSGQLKQLLHLQVPTLPDKPQPVCDIILPAQTQSWFPLILSISSDSKNGRLRCTRLETEPVSQFLWAGRSCHVMDCVR
jgi:hypothetical protein